MMAKKIRLTVLFLIGLLFVSISNTGFQTVGEAESITTYIHGASAEPFPDRLGYAVEVFVSAVDIDGTPLTDLTPTDFSLLEDSRPVKLESAEPVEDEAMNLIFLMDASGSMGSILSQAQSAAEAFVMKLGRNDRSAVISFNEEIRTESEFTGNHRDSTIDAIRRVSSVNNKGTCLYDGAYQALEMALAAELGHRAIVLFTDGRDEKIDGKSCSTKTIEDVLNFSRQNAIPIFALGFGNKVDESSLKRMSEISGGAYIGIDKPSDIEDAYLRLYRLMTNEYALKYTSTAASGPHTIVVETNYQNAVGRAAQTVVMPMPPTLIDFLSPKAGDTLSGEVLLSAAFLTQSVEIGSVKFSINGSVIGEAQSKPFETRWDTSTFRPGADQTLEVVAYDRLGGEAARKMIPVSIVETLPEEIPTVRFSSPSVGSSHQGSVRLSARVDSITKEVGYVTYYCAGKELGRLVSEPYEFDWDVSAFESGNIIVEAIATGKDGNELARTSMMIYIQAVPPTETPVVETTSGSRNGLPVWVYLVIALFIIIIIILVVLLFKKRPVPETEPAPFVVNRVADEGDFETGTDVNPAVRQGALATLEVLSSDDSALVGNVYNVMGLPLSIGRSAENEIVFSKQDQAISRFHAVLEDVNGQIVLRDSNSKFGTFVNEQRVSDVVELNSGDLIRLGLRTTLRFTKAFRSAMGSDDATLDGTLISPDSTFDDTGDSPALEEEEWS